MPRAADHQARAMDHSDLGTALQQLGMTLQRLREQRSLTLEELAERSSVSMGTLSLLERGQGNPSVATLLKIATALKVPIPVFFHADRPDDGIVVRAGNRRRLVTGQEEGRRYELLTPDVSGAIEMLWVELDPGVWTEEDPITHEGEECLVVLEGTLEAHIGSGRPHLLRAGDSIYVRSEIPHHYKSHEAGRARLVIAITPPSF